MSLSVPGNKIAVVPLFDTTKVGSLYIPEQARERSDQGIVKYIGPLVEDIKPGDHVIFSGYTGTLLHIDGEGILIVLPEEFVEAKLDYQNHSIVTTDIPGLYFKGEDGEYFLATYEMAMNLITQGIEETDWWKELSARKKNYKLDSQRPSKESYARKS